MNELSHVSKSESYCFHRSLFMLIVFAVITFLIRTLP